MVVGPPQPPWGVGKQGGQKSWIMKGTGERLAQFWLMFRLWGQPGGFGNTKFIPEMSGRSAHQPCPCTWALRGALCPSVPTPHASCLELPPSLPASPSLVPALRVSVQVPSHGAQDCSGLLHVQTQHSPSHRASGMSCEARTMHAHHVQARSPRKLVSQSRAVCSLPAPPSQSFGPLLGCPSPAITVALDLPQISTLSDPGPWPR